jgi:hypothetical protein
MMGLPVAAGDSLREVRHTLRSYPGFALVVLITLGLAGLIGLMVLLMQVLGGFLGMAHFTEPQHRTHDLTYGLLFTTAVVGLLAQLRRPSKNVAGMLMALLPWVGLLLAAVLSTETGVIRSAERILVAAGTVTAALLHPARRDLVRSLSPSRVNWVMLALLILAAVPLLAFASTNIGLQRSLADDHAAMGHYGFMAAFGFTVIGVGLLASLRPEGWRLTAWVAGLLPALLGLASVVYPEVSSSLGRVWSLAAMGWGIAFVVTAELTRHAESPRLLGSLGGPRSGISKGDSRVEPDRESIPDEAAERAATSKRGDTHMAEPPPHPDSKGDTGYDTRVGRDRASPPGMPRWVKVSGIIIAVLVLVVVILAVTGVLPGQHGPGQFGPGQHGP